jgi:hypothetical protein
VVQQFTATTSSRSSLSWLLSTPMRETAWALAMMAWQAAAAVVAASRRRRRRHRRRRHSHCTCGGSASRGRTAL